VLLESHEAGLEVFSELLELFRLLTPKNVNELLRQLEGCLFELKALPREA